MFSETKSLPKFRVAEPMPKGVTDVTFLDATQSQLAR